MRRGGGVRSQSTTRLVLYALAGAVLVLALAQVLLPRIATSRISSRVGRYGAVERVSVSAWPAVELLWGSADSVRVRARHLSLSPAQAAALLWEGRGAQSMDLTAGSLQVGPLRLSDARLRKRGSALSAEARASEADVRAALPAGWEVKLLNSRGGDLLKLGGLGLLGASVDAVALASEGRLVAHPLGLPLEGLRLTLFSDRHVHVEGVGARLDSGQPPAYRLRMRASLR